ncbi:MAG TPA: alpha-amylase [Bacteroidales bacterium]|nr:alpha-amylase [Bacteroidales bacterium]
MAAFTKSVKLLFTISGLFSFLSSNVFGQKSEVVHPEWSRNATIYEVNLRQYTNEGTLKAFEKYLPELKEMGVDIIWFMPIHPIGEVNRKGSLGSYYSVKDYLGVNPEFGTLEDFKIVVAKAHGLGMKVIIDWVANHTSHDAILINEHPDWYVRDSTGKVISPFDWSDVAKLDYTKMELRQYIVDAMKFWIKDAGIDGFRCDVAAEVPTDFWNDARKQLDEIKPVFMLAEAEKPEMQQYAFDADYGWEFHHIMNQIAQGKMNVNNLEKYLLKNISEYPKNTNKLNFITNHDENSWNGTEFERMGESVKTFAALSFVMPGMPLIYSGQEVGFNRRLKFFDKDQINWNDSLGLTPFYKKLVELKKSNSVLAAGDKGADIFRIKSTNDSCIFAFTRKNEVEKLLAVFNLSSNEQKVSFEGDDYPDSFTNYMTGESKVFIKGEIITLKPWEFHIFIKNK